MNFQPTQQPVQELVSIDIEKKKNEVAVKVQNSAEVQAIISQIDL